MVKSDLPKENERKGFRYTKIFDYKALDIYFLVSLVKGIVWLVKTPIIWIIKKVKYKQ